jgi:hypothetical protein
MKRDDPSAGSSRQPRNLAVQAIEPQGIASAVFALEQGEVDARGEAARPGRRSCILTGRPLS